MRMEVRAAPVRPRTHGNQQLQSVRNLSSQSTSFAATPPLQHVSGLLKMATAGLSVSMCLRSARRTNAASRRQLQKRIGCCAAESEVAGAQALEASLATLRETNFFSLFRLDLFASCRVLCQEDQGCTLECEVDPTGGVPDFIEEEDQKFVYEIDGWYRLDPPVEDVEYYDLRSYPEKYTGYDGSIVWQFIHDSLAFPEPTKHDAEANLNVALDALHTSISAHIVADIRAREENGDTIDGNGSAAEFARRFESRPQSVQALQSAQALLLHAVHAASQGILSRDFGDESSTIMPELSKVCAVSAGAPSVEKAEPSDVLRDCRLRLRELCIVMDCVECNFCRMHAKVAAVGIGTAFKILYSDSTKDLALSRVEVAALIVSLEKFTDALRILKQFKGGAL